MKIAHFTDASSGGVLVALGRLARRQAEAGADVTVFYAPRADTPSHPELITRYFPGIRVVRTSREPRGVKRLWALARGVHTASSSSEFDVIHLHSSIAGAVGRLASGPVSRRGPVVVYSPHGYAFLREDLPTMLRGCILVVERLLVHLSSASVLASASETRLAQTRVKESSAFTLRNGVPPVMRTGASVERQIPVVAMAGRVAYQKAPWRFAALANEFSGRAKFLWIGSGDAGDVEKWLGANVELTGWLPQQGVQDALRRTDIFVFPTLWEGMPLSLMEAQAMGIPAIASKIVGNVDVIVDGETGFLVSNDRELIERTRLLLSDVGLRARMSLAASAHATQRLGDSHLGTESLALYDLLVGRTRRADTERAQATDGKGSRL